MHCTRNRRGSLNEYVSFCYFSVLLPERLMRPAHFAPSAPAFKRVSPELHPSIVFFRLCGSLRVLFLRQAIAFSYELHLLFFVDSIKRNIDSICCQLLSAPALPVVKFIRLHKISISQSPFQSSLIYYTIPNRY